MYEFIIIIIIMKNMKKTFLQDLNICDHKNIERCNQNDFIELIHYINVCDEQLIIVKD